MTAIFCTGPIVYRKPLARTPSNRLLRGSTRPGWRRSDCRRAISSRAARRTASNRGGLSPSTQRLVEDIRRRLEAERLSRPGVQLGCDLVEPGLADQVEV